MPKATQQITKKDIEQLLNSQTIVILDAVDEKISGVRADLVSLEIKIDKKFEAMEERWNRKFDKLTTTLDKFLKKMMDMQDEFAIMKHDIVKMKKIIREKLGVDLT